jgi:hypothetical protein
VPARFPRISMAWEEPFHFHSCLFSRYDIKFLRDSYEMLWEIDCPLMAFSGILLWPFNLRGLHLMTLPFSSRCTLISIRPTFFIALIAILDMRPILSSAAVSLAEWFHGMNDCYTQEQFGELEGPQSGTITVYRFQSRFIIFPLSVFVEISRTAYNASPISLTV